jgi:hypothetical protein
VSTPTKVIGVRTRFVGGSGEHPYLLGHEVVVIGVIRGAQVIMPGMDYAYVSDDEALVATGGLDVLVDRLDVAPLVPDAGAPEGERPSFASSDVRPSDLEAFAVVVSAEPGAVPSASVDYERMRLVRQAEGTLARTGRMYKIALEKLDTASLREVLRLLRDLEQDKDAAVRRARIEPWRR